MLSGGVGALRAPDFDGPDAGLGCDGAVNNKDSPSLFSLFPPSSSPFPLFPESTNLQGARRWRPEAEGRRPTKMGGWVGGCVRGVAPRKFWNTGPGGQGKWGKWGIWEGMGKKEEEKSGGKEKIFFGRKNFFYTTEKCTLWVRQSIAIDNVIWGSSQEACRRFL